jgi:hypothetical protein
LPQGALKILGQPIGGFPAMCYGSEASTRRQIQPQEIQPFLAPQPNLGESFIPPGDAHRKSGAVSDSR